MHRICLIRNTMSTSREAAHEATFISREQAGHLRHFHNLATQIDGEWRNMGSLESGQELLEGYRYQLANMAYAAGLAHYHHLPALKSPFRHLFRDLINKMLRREVWGYWYLTSQSGIFVDQDLTELRKPWADPIKRENIMYSGHLLLMVSMYAMLFDSDDYDAPGSLNLTWNPLFLGMGSESFRYHRLSLQAVVLAEMEKTGWMGACCEPNCVFVACNQFPLIAFRLNDARDGTNFVEHALPRYTEAWQKKTASGGYFDISPPIGNTHRTTFPYWQVKQDKLIPGLTGLSGGISMNAWAATFMHAWNNTYVEGIVPSLLRGFLTGYIDGGVSVNSGLVAQAVREQAESDPTSLLHSESVIAEAVTTVANQKIKAQQTPSPMGLTNSPPSTDFGFTIQMLSEIASTNMYQDALHGMFKHADTRFSPTWVDGGLYYPRKIPEASEDAQSGIADPPAGVDAYTGNAAIAFARLNVPDGLKQMWDEPWTRRVG
ncbi:hypothetical protein KVT40_006756 [Elsinoe batatas]|uniref:Linalool dehydratase/isomerase domain-containing protein n=1 Tax=Elsinoe batatas TaxID=2601811 RepID=A0A8K0PAU0_9PEZI|nr:hypothetical protein KVT40_006756 [Elsinoe batatas]